MGKIKGERMKKGRSLSPVELNERDDRLADKGYSKYPKSIVSLLFKCLEANINGKNSTKKRTQKRLG
jgi:hypothetical protein